jgi:hypothetical protein
VLGELDNEVEGSVGWFEERSYENLVYFYRVELIRIHFFGGHGGISGNEFRKLRSYGIINLPIEGRGGRVWVVYFKALVVLDRILDVSVQL